MTPQLILANAIAPALALLPAKMDSREARAMLLAIGLQESKLRYRAQVGGPARGYWQFEAGGGVKGVLTHAQSKAEIQAVLAALDYPMTVSASFTAIEHNDILAAAFARLLLYTLPDKLPTRVQTDIAWGQYIMAWRPGKPHPATWPGCFSAAWTYV